MTEAEITYAKVGGPPEGWRDLRVVDLDTGTELGGVLEVNTAEGWLVRHVKDESGYFKIDKVKGQWVKERITGRFGIRRS